MYILNYLYILFCTINFNFTIYLYFFYNNNLILLNNFVYNLDFCNLFYLKNILYWIILNLFFILIYYWKQYKTKILKKIIIFISLFYFVINLNIFLQELENFRFDLGEWTNIQTLFLMLYISINLIIKIKYKYKKFNLIKICKFMSYILWTYIILIHIKINKFSIESTLLLFLSIKLSYFIFKI